MLTIDIIDNSCLLRRANIVARAHTALVQKGIPRQESDVGTYSSVSEWMGSVSGRSVSGPHVVFLHREAGWQECVERCAELAKQDEAHFRLVTYTGSSASNQLAAAGLRSGDVAWWVHFHDVKSVRDFEGSSESRAEVAATVGRQSPPVEDVVGSAITGQPVTQASHTSVPATATADLEHNLVNGVGPLRYGAEAAAGRQSPSIENFELLWRELQQRLESSRDQLPDWLNGWLIDRSQRWADQSNGPNVGTEEFHGLKDDLDRILRFTRTLSPQISDPFSLQDLIQSLPTQDPPWKLLWIEDEESWGRALGTFFEACGFDVCFELDPCERLEDDSDLDAIAEFDAVLLDMTLAGLGTRINQLLVQKQIHSAQISDENAGVGVLKLIRSIPNAPPIFLFSAREDADIIRACTQLGAAGYCVKGRPEYYTFLTQLLNELRHRRQQLDEIKRPKNPNLIVGDSTDPLLNDLGKLDRAARTQGPIFLWGQAGVGKNELAKEIHARSGRSGEFNELRCSDFTDMDSGMVSSAFFGHVAGAHNMATTQVEGALWYANQGTLFVDEIDKLDAANRNKFLAFLNERKYYRTGDQSNPISVDVLVVLASNEPEDSFPAPLRRRIAKFPFEVPRLVDRSSVVPELVRALCDRVCFDNDLAPPKQFSDEAVAYLQKKARTGGFDETNIGGLLNLVERAVVYSDAQEQHIDLAFIREIDNPASAPRSRTSEDAIVKVGQRLAEYVESQETINLQELQMLARGAMLNSLYVSLSKDEAREKFGQNKGAFRKMLNDMKRDGWIDFGAQDWK